MAKDLYYFQKDSVEDFLRYMKQMYTTSDRVQIGDKLYDVSDIVVGFERHSFEGGELIDRSPAGTKGPLYANCTREIKIKEVVANG